MRRGVVRALQDGDADQVRTLFAATAAVGRPLLLPAGDLSAYSALCLDYYLEVDGSACGVHVEEGVVTGYAMVALDHAAYERWARPRAVRWAARAVARMPLGLGGTAAAFHFWRLRDGIATLRAGVAPPMPSHFHFNVDVAHRGLAAGFLLAAHADRVVGAAGLPGYFGEVNVAVGKPGRLAAFERLGARVVHRQHNYTLSWLAGQPVERLTVVRSLDAAAGWLPLPHAL
ncbi:hypothetical protein BH23ACT9_BH23ACT9_25020 [soil metagenome]